MTIPIAIGTGITDDEYNARNKNFIRYPSFMAFVNFIWYPVPQERDLRYATTSGIWYLSFQHFTS